MRFTTPILKKYLKKLSTLLSFFKCLERKVMKKGILLAIGSYIAWGVLSIFWKYLGKIDSY